MVATIELGVDNSVERNLKELAKIQAHNERLQEIIRIAEQDHADVSDNIMVKDGILYSKDAINTLTGGLYFLLNLKSL